MHCPLAKWTMPRLRCTLNPMRPFRFMIVLLLAAILFAEPVMHAHPITGNSGGRSSVTSTKTCALCAVAAQQITVVRSVATAPVHVVDCLIDTRPHPHSVHAFLALPSRAPPAA